MTSATTEAAADTRGYRGEGHGLDVVALYGLCAYGSRENAAP
jgi:hypothetical protein